jgi:hypothetical protein
MRKRAIVGVLAGLVVPLVATTLQQLSLADLAQQSTSIVRGNLQPSYTALRGSVIYTHYTVQVTEVWKGGGAQTLDVAVPGGVLNGTHQTYSGAPSFVPGQDYVVFLWTSRGGLTQVMGLSQGLFTVSLVSGVPTITRAAATENLLGPNGQTINATNFSMNLSDFHASVNQLLGINGATN